MADPLILVRGVHFAATLLACGTVAFTSAGSGTGRDESPSALISTTS